VSPSVDTADGDVQFEYTPHLDGDPDPGEVVWTWVPYEDDPSQGKDRPVLQRQHFDDVVAGVRRIHRRR